MKVFKSYNLYEDRGSRATWTGDEEEYLSARHAFADLGVSEQSCC